MKIAIAGAGISGLTAAHYLHPNHEVTVYEAGSYPGGHTNTVSVDWQGELHNIDTGFIVCNDRTYPNFLNLLNELRVPTQPTEMSFSVRSDRENLEYNGSSLRGVFSQRRNLIRPRFLRMLKETLRFFKHAPTFLASEDRTTTVEEYCREERYSDEFVNWHLVPMGAAIWSASPQTFRQFPMRFVIEFYQNHGLLGLKDRPQWLVVSGGSARYVDALIEPFRERIRLNEPIEQVERLPQGVRVTAKGECAEYEHLIFACHSDQALRLLVNPDTLEQKVLEAIPYQKNTAILHTDGSILPKSKRAWASWNYHLDADPTQPATVTYYMNRLQQIESDHSYCVTLNREEGIDPSAIIRRMTYHHPVFTTSRDWAQSQHRELINRRGISYCGAYWANGFHEDGVNSALAVVETLNHPAKATVCEVASTPVR